MVNNKLLFFTGGGSAGHVTPNLELIRKFSTQGWQIGYIGSYEGIEKSLVAHANIPYYAISSGKLRRHLSWQNFIDPFKVLWGIAQAFFLLHKLKPAVVFSKGGFVSFPVVFAAWLNRIPVVIHESDLTPGLANRLSYPFAQKICLAFADTKNYFKSKTKLQITGTPIRKELLTGNAEQGLALCGFNRDKKVILVIGGGLGAASINQTVRTLLPELLNRYQVIHLCGKGKVDNTLLTLNGYKQFEYVHDELASLFACTNLIITRAGANTLFEVITLHKPHILIPLSLRASRGDQIANAKYFAKQGLSEVIFEEDLTPPKLLEKIIFVDEHEEELKKKLASFTQQDSTDLIYNLIINLK